EKYSQVDPVDYEAQRFQTPAGELIDRIEKETVCKLLLNSGTDVGRKLKILDVACGTGRLAFFLEDNLTNADITGIDINDNMLSRARKIGLSRSSRVKFRRADFYNLPYKNNHFDVVAGLRFSMHIPDLNQVFKELSRVLKAGGILIFDIFNKQSILRLKIPTENNNQPGYYYYQNIISLANTFKLKFKGKKGIFLFGETIIRQFPNQLMFLLMPLITPPFFLEGFSTKIILCFRKIS
ncbi:class I SAM-dependent methyltransferase, partial [Candidatus Gottesmanbacteria bacterium]|nr:class I SAM-dependent methyltransferase [Candidatus Gottesmanbacteria bacterium]